MHSAQTLIQLLELTPYPSGGYFKETYRSPERVPAAALPERYAADHSLGTVIYFLLEAGQVSPLHRLKTDEIWHFYAGGPLRLHIFGDDNNGDYTHIDLGPDPEKGHTFQAVAPAGGCFGATLHPSTSFSLVGCSMAPGFDISDFIPGDPEALAARFPHHKLLIDKLFRGSR